MRLPNEDRAGRPMQPLTAPRCERAVEREALRARLAALPADELEDALSHARIHTLYQPVVRFSDRRPVGLEVLARLEHPILGTLDPSLFVPLMEDAGLGWKLTEAVVIRAFADWEGSRLDMLDLTLALNIPLDVLLFPEALTRLDIERVAAGIATHRLVLELTESRPVVRLPELRMAAQRMRTLGYGLAIDDVGPEIRDHSPLLDLPFTMMKLDKEVVQDAVEDPAAHAFLVDAIATARRAGLSVIAEGVEDEATWAHMRRLGVDQAQGYLVGRPLPASAVRLWHAEWCGDRRVV